MDSKKLYEEQIEYAAGLLKKPPIDPTHFYFACPKCGYASLIPCGTDTRPDQSEPGEQQYKLMWIRENNRFICPICRSETEKYTNLCSVCNTELV